MKERLARNVENLRNHLGAPAVGAAIVGRTGATAVAVSGMTEIGGSTAVTDGDAWHIGSCTKTITALTVASLIEEGLLEWDTPLSHVFADVNGIDSDWNAATVEDLLQCRAGIGANLPFGDLHDWHTSVDSESDQRSIVAAQTLSEPPQGLGKFVYSNLGYILVGALIDRVADRTYERAVFDRILNPLGVTDSGFGAPPRIAGHRRALQVGPVGFGRLATLGSDNRRKVMQATGEAADQIMAAITENSRLP